MNQLIWSIWIKRCISSIKDIKKLTLPIRNNAQLKETPHNFSLFVRKRRLMSNSRNQTHRQAKKFLFSFIALEPTCNTGNLRVESLRVNNNFFLTESAGSIGEYWLREVAVRIERSEVRARTTESQCSLVRLEPTRTVRGLLSGTRIHLVYFTFSGFCVQNTLLMTVSVETVRMA